MAGATFAHHFIGEKFMRILLLTFNTVGKGTYWRALYLAREMSKLGHQVTLMATARQSRLEIATKQDQESAVTLVETPDLLWGLAAPVGMFGTVSGVWVGHTAVLSI
jgi:hypothetical protein